MRSSTTAGPTQREHRLAMHAEWAAHLVLLAIGTPLLVLWIVVAFKVPASGWEKAVAIIVGLEAFGHFWLLRYLIEADDERITYRSLFSGTRTLRFSGLRRASIRLRGPLEPPYDEPNYCLMLEDDAGSSHRPVMINMKPFRMDDLGKLAAVIVAKAPSADISDSVHRLAKGELRRSPGFRRQSAVQVAALVFTVALLAALVRLLVVWLLP